MITFLLIRGDGRLGQMGPVFLARSPLLRYFQKVTTGNSCGVMKFSQIHRKTETETKCNYIGSKQISRFPYFWGFLDEFPETPCM